LQAFNKGDYYGAVEDNVASENLTKILYPNDASMAGKQLRLEQQYFFVSCSLQDMIRIHLQRAPTLHDFHEKYAVQLNDTHPSISVAELMRLLLDEHGMGWDEAWEITRRTFGYTNHTLLPEALEKWPVGLFSSLLPRHMQIIYELNRRFLDEVRAAFPGDDARVQRLSLIDETGGRHVRMAHLACVGSQTINGVAKLHSELLARQLLHDFHALWPDRFLNVTNGVTPRRFVVLANPRLAALITEAVGDDWARDLEDLGGLERFASDGAFRERWGRIKLENKADLARIIERKQGLRVDPRSLFDVQVKRFHEYKRQHLNLLHVISRYARLKREGRGAMAPRTFIFGGKAAPGYFLAKQIIHLIHCVGNVVNADPDTRDWLKVVFLPNFNVSNAQRVYPAADLSEQISTAGMEASGTGNMKFSMNGALTLGTLDGANVEIREAVGPENFFLFGLDAGEVQALKARGYEPAACYHFDPRLREAIDLVASGFFSGGDRTTFQPLVDSLLYQDPFLVLADFAAYVDCQEAVDAAFARTDDWVSASILNVARMGRFSSDRAIREYCRHIWKVEPVPIELQS
ncbi:MAG: glycogen/starch/alpha-glucan phosphorylase, partial [Candidatus Riflebacteria bacterium]|nr:glycogen/starch/alpha-glucan phosphorylase [Candidatus Riflebacteria bacterium]